MVSSTYGICGTIHSVNHPRVKNQGGLIYLIKTDGSLDSFMMKGSKFFVRVDRRDDNFIGIGICDSGLQGMIGEAAVPINELFDRGVKGTEIPFKLKAPSSDEEGEVILSYEIVDDSIEMYYCETDFWLHLMQELICLEHEKAMLPGMSLNLGEKMYEDSLIRTLELNQADPQNQMGLWLKKVDAKYTEANYIRNVVDPSLKAADPANNLTNQTQPYALRMNTAGQAYRAYNHLNLQRRSVKDEDAHVNSQTNANSQFFKPLAVTRVSSEYSVSVNIDSINVPRVQNLQSPTYVIKNDRHHNLCTTECSQFSVRVDRRQDNLLLMGITWGWLDGNIGEVVIPINELFDRGVAGTKIPFKVKSPSGEEEGEVVLSFLINDIKAADPDNKLANQKRSYMFMDKWEKKDEDDHIITAHLISRAYKPIDLQRRLKKDEDDHIGTCKGRPWGLNMRDFMEVVGPADPKEVNDSGEITTEDGGNHISTGGHSDGEDSRESEILQRAKNIGKKAGRALIKYGKKAGRASIKHGKKAVPIVLPVAGIVYDILTSS